jgi:uncharacterized SAM-binding protein YcdF (DUF218 family)
LAAVAVLGLSALAILLSVPLVSDFLVDRLQIYPEIAPSELLAQTGGQRAAIVILSAGRRTYAPEYGGETVDALSLERIRYGAYLARKTDLPVLVSGGLGDAKSPSLAELLAATLSQDYGIRSQWLEHGSTNTAENAIFSSRILKQEGISRIVLVTHAWHLERARAAFMANGMSVIPAPTAFYRPVRRSFLERLIPSIAAFRMSGYAVHESLGIAWYAFRYGY